MRKIAVSILLTLICIPLFAGSIRYVYGNSISSNDFSEPPKIGDLFISDCGNVLAVKALYEDIVVFDKLITRGPYRNGDELVARKALNSMSLLGTLDFAIATYGLSTRMYPLSPMAVVGVDYRNGLSALVMAGVRIHVCLAGLWDGMSTFIQNGKVNAWCALGSSISSEVDFACTYGVTYSHNIGMFRWEAGVSDLEVLGKPNSFGFCLGLGVDV